MMHTCAFYHSKINKHKLILDGIKKKYELELNIHIETIYLLQHFAIS